MEQKTELIFPDGIRFFKPRDNAPKTIKGNMVIELSKLVDWAEQQGIKGDQQLRIDLRKSETKGTYYFTLNTWKPSQKDAPTSENSRF